MTYNKKRTYLKVCINIGIMVLAILFCILILPKFIVCFLPFVVGWIIAMIASPLVQFFEKHLKIRRRAGSAVVIIAVIALVILAGYGILAWLLEQIISFMEYVPDMWAGAQSDFSSIEDNLSAVTSRYFPKEFQTVVSRVASNIQEYAGNLIGRESMPTMEAIGAFAKNIPNVVISIMMGLLFTYFCVADREYLPGLLEKILPESVLRRFQMIKRGLARAIGGYFKAQLKIEVWMYFLLAIGFTILGIDYAFIIAIGVAFLDLLPFFGTGTVLIPWALVKMLSGDYRLVIGLLIIWGVGLLVRQLIQPKIVGDSVGLAPMPTVILLYFGYKVGGVLGMILAVPIGIILINLYQEGVFDTTIKSCKILYASLSNLRHLTSEDMEEVEKYRRRTQMSDKEKNEKL